MSKPIPIKKALIVYKKSSYHIYFLEKKSSLYRKQHLLPTQQVAAFRRAHEAHYATLDHIKKVLKKYDLDFSLVSRGQEIKTDSYGLVITVGGDGTFLETARYLAKGQPILGVNSDPQRSVGRFCTANAKSFAPAIKNFISGKFRIRQYHRYCLTLKKARISLLVLNEALVCHMNPAAMSRYRLTIGKISEEQRSSGLWISTAAGSTGAIHSAGGKIMKWDDKHIQYKPRELYRRQGEKMRLKGGILLPTTRFYIDSFMREGVVFIDGEHLRHDFSFGERISITACNNPVAVVDASK